MVNTENSPRIFKHFETKRCRLCIHKKLYIATYRDQEELLNKLLELTSKCRHENKFVLANYKAND